MRSVYSYWSRHLLTELPSEWLTGTTRAAKESRSPLQTAVEYEEELWRPVWSAVRQGALILPKSGAEDLLAEVDFSPLGRVNKRGHLGRIKPVGRLIHDISHGGKDSVIARTDQSAVPDMVLLVVEHAVLYWKTRYPSARVTLTKRDVDSAFRRIPLEPGGMKYSAAVLGAWAVILLMSSPM